MTLIVLDRATIMVTVGLLSLLLMSIEDNCGRRI